MRRSSLALVAAVALYVAGCGGGSSGRPSVAAKPATRYADSPVTVDIRGLQPGQRATVRARWTPLSGRPWASSVPVRADGDGAVALRGLDGMRFLWGMTPVARRRGRESFFPPARGANRGALSLVAGGKTVARAALERRVTTGAVPYLPHSTHQEFFGGTLRGDAAPRADLWPRILGFFANL